MQRILLPIILVVVVIGIAVFAVRGRSGTTSTDVLLDSTPSVSTELSELSEEAGGVVVVYTNEGFSPAEVNVPVGTAVSFENASSKKMWVASDPHPIHTKYGEFDAKEGIAPGETYTFTFTQKGEWGYHDHLDSSARGVVVVE